MSTKELRARLVEHLAIRAYRTEDGDPSLKALVEYERAVRAEALREAARRALPARFRVWLRAEADRIGGGR